MTVQIIRAGLATLCLHCDKRQRANPPDNVRAYLDFCDIIKYETCLLLGSKNLILAHYLVLMKQVILFYQRLIVAPVVARVPSSGGWLSIIGTQGACGLLGECNAWIVYIGFVCIILLRSNYSKKGRVSMVIYIYIRTTVMCMHDMKSELGNWVKWLRTILPKEYILVRERTATPCVFRTFAHPPPSPPACYVRQSGS